LGECLQRGCTVREYVSELYELWNLIGDVGEREKVTKLRNGFQYWIQSELWKDKLNPEKSSLREVIAAAEVIEIAHSVGGNNNKRTGEKGRQSSSGGATTGFSMSDGCHSKDDSRSNKGTNAASHGQSGDNKQQFRASQKGKHREGGNAKAGKELTKKLKLSKEDRLLLFPPTECAISMTSAAAITSRSEDFSGFNLSFHSSDWIQYWNPFRSLVTFSRSPTSPIKFHSS
jgi:hypothetical protein